MEELTRNWIFWVAVAVVLIIGWWMPMPGDFESEGLVDLAVIARAVAENVEVFIRVRFYTFPKLQLTNIVHW